PSSLENALGQDMCFFHMFGGKRRYLRKDDVKMVKQQHFPHALRNQLQPLSVEIVAKGCDECHDGK
uniref:Uncharacterized protein n=1 Tax=Sus scrofa TaxID=9823 RepID=A0A4X1W0S0_PIG